jgi:hypothetical protein
MTKGLKASIKESKKEIKKLKKDGLWKPYWQNLIFCVYFPQWNYIQPKQTSLMMYIPSVSRARGCFIMLLLGCAITSATTKMSRSRFVGASPYSKPPKNSDINGKVSISTATQSPP